MTELVQISVASDGRLKAVYASNDVLVLSSGGTLFAYIAKDQITRQTCEFAVSTFSEQLCAAIEFRNMHLDSVVWCRAMAKKHAQDAFTIRYPISFVRWPQTLHEAIRVDKIQVRLVGCSRLLLSAAHIPAKQRTSVPTLSAVQQLKRHPAHDSSHSCG